MKIKRHSIIPVGIVIVLTLVVAIVALFGFLPQARAEGPAGTRLVTIYDRGGEQSVITTKDTLREVFQEIGLMLDGNDIVEPGLDEQLVSNDYQVNIYRARPIVIQDGAQQIKVMSAYQTPEQITEHAGITMRSEDTATLQLTNNIMSDGASERLVIDRATPVNLVLYSKKETIYTQAETISELMQEKGLKLAGNDQMSLPGSALITPNMTIEIWRNGKQTITVEEEIDFSVEQIKDANRDVGYKEVKTPGVKGKRTVTYEVEMKNGKVVQRKAIQHITTKKPEKQVEIIGAKQPPVAGPAEIITKIKAASAKLGIDAQRVLLIAQCESGFNPRADSGYYKGLFQHDPNYWSSRAAKFGYAGASYFDVDAQIAVSTGMMAGGGWSHWGCDPGPQ